MFFYGYLNIEFMGEKKRVGRIFFKDVLRFFDMLEMIFMFFVILLIWKLYKIRGLWEICYDSYIFLEIVIVGFFEEYVYIGRRKVFFFNNCWIGRDDFGCLIYFG